MLPALVKVFSCSSSSVQTQVAPVTFKPGRQDDYSATNNDLVVDVMLEGSIRNKPKSERSSSLSKRTLEDEMFAFVLDIKTHAQGLLNMDNFLLECNSNTMHYHYECTSDANINAVLVIILRSTVLKKQITPAFSSSARVSSKGVERKANLIFAANCLITLLNEYQEYPKDFDTNTAYNGNCLTSVEKALIVSDIFLVAVINYVSNAANRVVVEESLNLTVYELLQAMLRIGHCISYSESEIDKVLWAQLTLRACNVVFYIVHVMKTTAFVPGGGAGSQIENKQQGISNYIKNMSDLVKVMTSLGSCVMLVRTLCGTTSTVCYTVSVCYWEACYRVLLLLKSKSFQSAESRQQQQQQGGGRGGGGGGANMDPRYFMLCSQLLNAFTSSAPNANELVQEIGKLLMTSTAAVVSSLSRATSPFGVVVGDLEDSNLINILISSNAFVRSSVAAREQEQLRGGGGGGLLSALQVKTQDIFSALGSSSYASSSITSPTLPNTISFGSSGAAAVVGTDEPINVEPLNQLSFRVRYLLCGVSYLLKISDFRKEYLVHNALKASIPTNPSAISLNLPSKSLWIVSLGQCLLSLLVPNTRGAFASASVMALGPHLAQMLLKIVFGGMDSLGSSVKVDSILWELAKHLGLYTDLLKRRLRSLTSMAGAVGGRNSNGSLNNNNRGHHTLSASNSVNSGLSLESHQVSLRSFNNTTHKTKTVNSAAASVAASTVPVTPGGGDGFYLNMETPSKPVVAPLYSAASPKSAIKPSASPKATPARLSLELVVQAQFEVGDLVDGQCELANGTKRWYPGKITSKNVHTNTYGILYNDGDTATDKPVDEIRPTKRRMPSNAGSVTSTAAAPLIGPGSTTAPEARDAPPLTQSNKWLESPQPGPTPTVAPTESARSSADAAAAAPHHLLPSGLNPLDVSESSLLITPVKSLFSQMSSNSPDFFVLSPFSDYGAVGPTFNFQSPIVVGDNNPLEEDKQEEYGIHSIDSSLASVRSEEAAAGAAAAAVAAIAATGVSSARDVGVLEHQNSHSSHVLVHTPQLSHSGREDTGALTTTTGFVEGGRSMSNSRYGTSVKSVTVDDDLDAEDDDDETNYSEEDRIYEIPSVFEGHARIMNHMHKTREDIVPRMRFDDLNMSAALPLTSSALSLSGTLLSNEQSFRAINNSARNMSYRSVESGHHHNAVNKSHYANMLNNNGRNSVTDHLADDTVSGGTRMLSWRGEESSRFTERSGNLMRPSGPPSDALISSQEAMQSRKLGSFRNKKGPLNSEAVAPPADPIIDLDDQTIQLMNETYSIVCGVLMQRCIDKLTFLDPSTCSCGEFPSPVSLESSMKSGTATPALMMMQHQLQSLHQPSSLLDTEQTNLLFNVREFLEVCDSGVYNSNLAELAVQHSNALLRLCKLMNGEFFKNCLPNHMDNGGIKIGEGGFGSVFQVSCSDHACGGFKQYKNCLACYRSSISQTSATTLGVRCVCWHSRHRNSDHTFAVKRIPRERSVYDHPVILDLFNEICALEALSGCIGVCGLEDYGVHGSEYWLVMEHGGINLNEWRRGAQLASYAFRRGAAGATAAAATGLSFSADEMELPLPMSLDDVALYLTLFADALLIVQAVHAADVAHFDIKCDNFILRDDPKRSLAYMRECHALNKPSGILFLADFGESVCHVNQQRSHPVKSKCRGTITIQSPEMLCCSDDNSGKNVVSAAATAAPVSVEPSSPPRNARKLFGPPGLSSDIWALGCLLFEIFTGGQLFAEKAWPQMFVDLCMETFTPVSWEGLREVMASVAGSDSTSLVEEVGAVLDGALRQEAHHRTSIEEMVKSVDRILTAHCQGQLQQALVSSTGAAATTGGNPFRKGSSSTLFIHLLDNSSSQADFSALSDSNPGGALDGGDASVVNQAIDTHYRTLREEYTALNFNHIHMGHGVYLALEDSREVLDYFDKNNTILHTSRDPFNLNPLDINLDVARTVAGVDAEVRGAGIGRCTSEIGRSVVHRQMKLDGSIVWIRISNTSVTVTSNGLVLDGISGSTAGKSGRSLFDKFMRKNAKVCSTYSINLNQTARQYTGSHVGVSNSNSCDSLDDVVQSVHKVVKKVLSQYTLNQSIVVISVDSAPHVVADATTGATAGSDSNNGRVYFDKQSVSVGTAVAGLLTSSIEMQLSASLTSNAGVAPNRSSSLTRLVQLWRSLPWFEGSCSEEVVDHIIRRIHDGDVK